MIVSPLDYRYGRDKMKGVFSEENRLRIMLSVEAALAQAESYYKIIPENAYNDIQRVVNSNQVKLERVKEIEKHIKHDVMAIVDALTEKCNEGKNYVHFGVTSNDINDSATAVQIHDAINIITSDLIEFMNILIKLINENMDTIMVGRTHGQHASPITFGLKLSVYLSEITRHLERLSGARQRIIVGKISGPVGTGAALGDRARDIQNKTCEILRIRPETASTQIVCRDRYIEYLSILNNISVSLEKFATEVRNLQRPEINEVSEYFNSSEQVGSSSMPSKRNPVNAENIVSLCRLIRSYIIPEYEAGIQWHERDLTNSALERFTIPYTSILTDDVLAKSIDLFKNIYINKDEMLKKVINDQFIMSESVTVTLARNGMPRQEAHEFVREASMKAYMEKISFKESLIKNGIEKFIDKSMLDDALDPFKFTGMSREICMGAIEEAENMIKYATGDLYD
ncbi:adenylosuccinate lyase [Acidiplasma aeolicum]|uniref:Adenylosuccinate lyase n=2 Tax=Acidiplasma TaxID=507753 RepID=A0A0Q0VS89_9ARCH|nr:MULTISPECIES: adenylosuccinate lyase [Acidiplasma]KPV46331.1 adenylosuccinate lyase [Acidiplasma aeolicum]KQB34182.1 adenylosuccinate lyase [Acidiplasma cupricumulans]KQB34621.1 adenylosuccinate lyase [Acidiplasma aeolicum]